ncbi:MAG TPA: acyl-CoA thioester hydrolase/BAAT C-terminal domain-containing protein [Puia sp.]|nr:acyl-CoA thioester hydrolase/BAAT C-terminal domain-containing protein [Puia sp.]
MDDRQDGVSTGDVSRVVTTADFSKDVETSFAWLKAQKKIDAGRIGLMGHSEGAMIAPIVASRNKDIAFIISLAGPAASFMKGIVSEYRAYLSATPDSMRPNYILSPEKFEALLAPQTATLLLDWWKFLLRYKASDYY